MRWPSASTTSLWADAVGMSGSGEDRQRKRRLHVEVALSHLGERAIENRLGALLERGDKRQAILAELRQLEHTVNVDPVLGVRGRDLSEDARLVVDGEADVVRRNEVAAHLVEA